MASVRSRQVAGPRLAAARAPRPFSPPACWPGGRHVAPAGSRSEEVRRQREAHVSAEQPQAGEAPRVPAPDVDPGRPGHHQVSPRQGPGSPLGVIWRIRDRAVFARFRRDGRRARVGSLWMSVIADPAAAPPRVGFAVGRSVGSAPVRNRVRRRLRALARAHADALAPGWYLVGADASFARQLVPRCGI